MWKKIESKLKKTGESRVMNTQEQVDSMTGGRICVQNIIWNIPSFKWNVDGAQFGIEAV